MIVEKKLKRIDGYIAIGVLAVLLVFAIVFMRLRMLNMDAPFMLYNIVNSGHPMIQEFRYGSIITQMWPWLGAEVDMSLIGLMHLYNISFNLFYLVVGALLVFRWKEYGLAILLALYYTLFVSSNFYWTNNEIHQAMGWTFIWWGLYRYQLKIDRRVILRYLTFGGTAILAAMTHPLIIPVLIFAWLFDLLVGREIELQKREILIFSLLLSMAIGLRLYFSFFAGWYDKVKISAVHEELFSSPFAVLDKPLLGELIAQYTGSLIGGTLFFIVSTVLLIYKRKYVFLAIFLGIIMVYHLLFLAVFNSWIDFYSRSELMPLTIIYCLPVIYYAPKVLNNWLLTSGFLIVFCIRLVVIYDAADFYKLRLDKTLSYLKQMRESNITKALIPKNHSLSETYIMSWALPSESLLASIISNDGVARTIKIVPAEDTTKFSEVPNNIFLDCFKEVPIERMNQRYFHLDTVQGYKVLK